MKNLVRVTRIRDCDRREISVLDNDPATQTGIISGVICLPQYLPYYSHALSHKFSHREVIYR